MSTIVLSPSTVSAVVDVRLTPSACNIIHPNGPRSLTVLGTTKGSGSLWKAEMSAHYVSVVDIPGIIANRAPLIIKENLHPTN